MRIENQGWRALTSEPFWSARNPHIHAFIVRQPTEGLALPDITGEWWFRWEFDPETILIGRWHRQALLPVISIQTRIQKNGHTDTDILDVVERTPEMVVLRSQNSERIFRCIPQSATRFLVSADPPGNAFVARRVGRSLKQIL